MKPSSAGLPFPAAAFSRLELTLSLAAITVALAIAVPSLKAARYKSHVQQCQHNLAAIYKAMMQTRDPATQRFFWQQRDFWGKPMAEKPAAVWFYMAHASNYLKSPKVLACPADTRKPATDWSTNSTGLAHPSHQDNAVSYFLAMDVYPQRTTSMFLGDRNILSKNRSVCHHMFRAALPTLTGYEARTTGIGWDNATLHKSSGHIVDMGGNIFFLDSPKLVKMCSAQNDGCTHMHFLFPEFQQLATK